MSKIKVDKNKFICMYYANSYKELAKNFGVSQGCVQRHARKLGLSKSNKYFFRVSTDSNSDEITGSGGLPHKKNCLCPSCMVFTIKRLYLTSLITNKMYRPEYLGPSLFIGESG